MKKQLIDYIENNKILAKHQSAFRKHSCKTAVNYLLNKWKIAKDKGETTVVVFLDLKRAFETVDRVIMMRKLSEIGIDGNILIWFESFSTNRRQKTKFKNALSDHINVPIAFGSVGTPGDCS